MSAADTSGNTPHTIAEVDDVLPLLRQPVGLRPYVLIKLAADEIEHLRQLVAEADKVARQLDRMKLAGRSVTPGLNLALADYKRLR